MVPAVEERVEAADAVPDDAVPDGAEVEAEVIGTAAVEAEVGAAVVEAIVGSVRVTLTDKQSVWVKEMISATVVSNRTHVPPPQGIRTLKVGRTAILLDHWQE